MKKLNKKGFTITELVIVISVIAILSAVMIPTFGNMISKSKDSAAVQDARNAYTEYLAENAGNETYVDDFVYKYDNDRYVAIVNGEIVESNGKKVFAKAAAEALMPQGFVAGTESDGLTPYDEPVADAGDAGDDGNG